MFLPARAPHVAINQGNRTYLLLDLKRILKLESIREKPAERRLRYIQNGCCEIGNPLGRTDGPDLQAYRAARFAEQNWQDVDDEYDDAT